MARQATIKATDVHRRFGKLLKRVYGSDEHLIVEREGYPVAVLMSYQEYEQLSQALTEAEETTQEALPAPAMTLEQTFGAVTPMNRPEDFKSLRDTAIEELTQRAVDKMKD